MRQSEGVNCNDDDNIIELVLSDTLQSVQVVYVPLTLCMYVYNVFHTKAPPAARVQMVQ